MCIAEINIVYIWKFDIVFIKIMKILTYLLKNIKYIYVCECMYDYLSF